MAPRGKSPPPGGKAASSAPATKTADKGKGKEKKGGKGKERESEAAPQPPKKPPQKSACARCRLYCARRMAVEPLLECVRKEPNAKCTRYALHKKLCDLMLSYRLEQLLDFQERLRSCGETSKAHREDKVKTAMKELGRRMDGLSRKAKKEGANHSASIKQMSAAEIYMAQGQRQQVEALRAIADGLRLSARYKPKQWDAPLFGADLPSAEDGLEENSLESDTPLDPAGPIDLDEDEEEDDDEEDDRDDE
ncbi:MAG: hypothetical protein M1826_007443 [Phylliscum demangeonii]|nr:MAG: hypothetical protein M1826_007443 [Phylliscum demangeonii]